MAALELSEIQALLRAHLDARLLLTALELDLFTSLLPRGLSVAELVERFHWEPCALRALLDGLVVLGLLEKRLEQYCPTVAAGELLTQDGQRSQLQLLRNYVVAARDAEKFSSLVVSTGVPPTAPGLSERLALRKVEEFELAPRLAALIHPEQGDSFVELGEGALAFSLALLDRKRALRGAIFQDSAQLELAQATLGELERLGELELIEGDYLSDPLPTGRDLFLLSTVIERLSLRDIASLFRRVWAALNPGGRLIIRDHLVAGDRLSPKPIVLKTVELLVSSHGGTTHTFQELRRYLQEAGFQSIDLLEASPRLEGVIEARKAQGLAAPDDRG